MSSRTPTADTERITAVIEPVVAAAGFDLEQVLITSAGRRSVLQVVVDTDGGVSLDDVATVGRVVSAALDEAEPTAFAQTAYTLEVSSPGVDRPLTEPRHWRRAVGRLVRTRVGDTTVRARVVSADEAGVTLDLAARRQVPYAELGQGTIQLEFGPPYQQGGGEDSA
ncbi:MAG: ribosome maturation factor RimP [Pseudonocardiales bacterium]